MMVQTWIWWYTLLAAASWIMPTLTANSDTKNGLCDCGYHDPSTDDQAVWTNGWVMDFGKDTTTTRFTKDFFTAKYEIPAKYKDSYSRKFSADNVKLHDQGLDLMVTINGDASSTQPLRQQDDPTARCAAIGTKRQDILYGSFRSVMRLTNTNGTVQTMYIYHPGGEIDIEVLGAVTPPQSYFAIHPGLQEPNGRASALTHDNHHLGFDPSTGFHEYRFDWYPDRVVFYIDGQLAQTLTTNIPQTPGRFMFSHWTDGNPKFSHGPPPTDATMEIKSIVALFNTSDHQQQQQQGVGIKCKQTQQSCPISGAQRGTSSSSSSPSPPQQQSSITLEGPSISDQKMKLLSPSDGIKITESYLVVFLFLIGCTVFLV